MAEQMYTHPVTIDVGDLPVEGTAYYTLLATGLPWLDCVVDKDAEQIDYDDDEIDRIESEIKALPFHEKVCTGPSTRQLDEGRKENDAYDNHVQECIDSGKDWHGSH